MLNRARSLARRDDGNVLLILLFSIAMLGLVIMVTVTVVSSLKKTAFTNNFTIARQWADATVTQAMYELNAQQALPPTKEGARIRCQAVEGSRHVCARYWAHTLPLGATTPTEYKVYVDSWVTEQPAGSSAQADAQMANARHVRRVTATLNGITTVSGGGTIDGAGAIAYLLAPPTGLTHAIYADEFITLTGNVVVSSYNSFYGNLNPTGYAKIGSDGNINIADGSEADEVVLYNATVEDFADRCIGELCIEKLRIVGPSVVDKTTMAASSTTPGTAKRFINDKINSGACATPVKYGTIRTSKINNGAPVTVTGEWCINGDLIIDSDLVSNAANETGPANIYVDGDVSIGRGVKVNIPTYGIPHPGNLYIYATGRMVSIVGGSDAHPTSVAAGLYAPSAACASTPTIGNVHYYGSLVCKSFNAQNKWRIWYDDVMTQHVDGSDAVIAGFPARTVWHFTEIEERLQS